MCAVRVGLIGTGFGASVQAPGFRCVDGAEVVAVASARMERARAVADEFGIAHAFDDYREMIRTVELDLISVTAPPYLHREMTLAALEAGAHVLCEKPLAMNVAEARDMLEAAQRSGRIHATDFEFRFNPARAAMKRLIDAGEIGDPLLIRVADISASYATRNYGWWFDRARGGGILQAIGAHYIDAVRWWVSPIVAVSADLRAVTGQRALEDGSGFESVTADESATVAFRLENGTVGSMSLVCVVPGVVRRAEVVGTKATLMMEGGAKLYKITASGSAEVIPDNRDQGRLEDPRLGAFVEQAQRVVDRINGRDGPSFTTFEDGLWVQRVMDAIHLSSDERREVAVSEIV